MAALEAAITTHIGEGGILIPSDGYLQQAERFYCQKNVLLVFDGIQAGLGLTGKMFAFKHEGVKPDGITIGKALSGGLYSIFAFIQYP